MSGVTKSHIQLGDSATAANNFMVTAQAADGTMKIARGNNGATTQDLITISATGNVQLTKTSEQSMIRLHTSNGYGSTNNKIKRFTTVVTTQGTDVTYADSATLGASFTINTSGVYSISYTDGFTASANRIGLSLNTSAPTTAIQSIPPAEILASAYSTTGSSAVNVGWTGYLPTGSIVRPHNESNTASTDVPLFTITRVA